MFSFFKKPFVFALIYGFCLAGLLSWSLLDVFVIPQKSNETTYETVDFSKFTQAALPDDSTEPVTGSGGLLSEETHGLPSLTLPPMGGEQEPLGTSTQTPNITEPPIGPETEPTLPTPDYPIITENTYIDEHISITITTLRRYDSDIHVAEVILDSPEYLKTALAHDTFGTNIKEQTSSQADRVGAILAVNGDFYGANKAGYVIRNGTLYRDSYRDTRYQDLAIFYDGSFGVFDEEDVALRDLLHKQGAMQVLAFGPTLVDNSQIVVDRDEEVGVASPHGNPRTIIGIVEPLHYFLVVADGRTAESYGPSLYQMADVMKELGCTLAYNLDGGGSATMVFMGKVINFPTTDGNYKERSVSDIVYIGY